MQPQQQPWPHCYTCQPPPLVLPQEQQQQQQQQHILYGGEHAKVNEEEVSSPVLPFYCSDAEKGESAAEPFSEEAVPSRHGCSSSTSAVDLPGGSNGYSSTFYWWRPTEAERRLVLPDSLSLYPVAASSLQRRVLEAQHRSPNGQLDPLAAALLWQQQQQQQENDGQPRSPLSPHTLQRLSAALAAGKPLTLTPEDLLSSPPLALTWHTNRRGGDGEPNMLQDSRVEVLEDDDTEGEEEGRDDARPVLGRRGAGGRPPPRRKHPRSDAFDATTPSAQSLPGDIHHRDEGGYGLEPLRRRPRTLPSERAACGSLFPSPPPPPQQQQQQEVPLCGRYGGERADPQAGLASSATEVGAPWRGHMGGAPDTLKRAREDGAATNANHRRRL